MMRRLFNIAAMLAPLAFVACGGDSPLGPGGEHATMRVGVNGMTLTTIGESIVIDAVVVNSHGDVIKDAEIAWDTRNADGVLVAGVAGKYTVMKEGTARIAAIWTRDPSVRATITVNVDAGLLAAACVVKVDQKQGAIGQRCAQQRVLVGVMAISPIVSLSDAPLAVPLHSTTGSIP